MKNHIFSPGKLLITSEYFVLDGALALAVPTRLGQDFYSEEEKDGASMVFWEALHENKPWLSIQIDYKNWEIVQTNLPESAAFILKVLQNVQKLSTEKFHSDSTYKITTNLQFPANYGLGSSSTLMNNLAEWFHIDAFLLNELSLGGSGYDIAVAQEKSAILYQNNPRKIERVEFNPSFTDDLIFIHLNQKQDSREGIRAFQSQKKSLDLRTDFSEITQKIGIYTGWDYARIIEHLVDFWKIETLTGLDGAAAKAQEFLANLADRYMRLADRIKAPDEVSLAWLK